MFHPTPPSHFVPPTVHRRSEPRKTSKKLVDLPYVEISVYTYIYIYAVPFYRYTDMQYRYWMILDDISQFLSIYHLGLFPGMVTFTQKIGEICTRTGR